MKNTQISNFMKPRPVGAEVFHADRRTDRHDEDNIRFSQFFKSPKAILKITTRSEIFRAL